MKILFVTTRYPAITETFFFRDVAGQIEKGNEILILPIVKDNSRKMRKLLCSRKAQGYRVLKKSSFFKIVVNLFKHGSVHWIFCKLLLKEERSLKILLKYIYVYFRSMAYYDSIIDEKVDIVHLFWGHYPMLLAMILKESNYSGKVTSFVGAYDFESRLVVTKEYLKKCDAVFTHCNYNNQILKNKYSVLRPHTIYRGIPTTYFTFDVQVKDYSRIDAVYVGALYESKNVEKTLYVIQRLVDLGVPISYKIVGDGSQMRYLKELVVKLGLVGIVHFYGWLESDSVRSILFSSNVFLFLSYKKAERLPNAVKEAMAAGCVPIVSSTIGIDELVLPETGFVVKHDDDESSIASKIVALLESEPEFRFRAKSAQEFVVKYFSIETSSNKYDEIWKNLLIS